MVRSRRAPPERPILSGLQPGTLSTTIVAPKSASGRIRAEQIRDVVDAFRRLHDSVQRFVRMFAGARDPASIGDFGAISLRELLSMLAREAQAARFGRLCELKLAIKEARLLERTRDAVFSESFSNDAVAMRETVTALEQVDAILVGLCVEHVLERHALATPRSQSLEHAVDRVRKRQPASAC